MVANSGRFGEALPLLLAGKSAFAQFLQFADWLHAQTAQTHQIAMERLFDLLHAYLTGPRGCAPAIVEAALLDDYARTGARGKLGFMLLSLETGRVKARSIAAQGAATPNRQARHLPA